MEAAELSAPYEDKQLGGVLPVYDGRSACFTASPLPTPPNGGTLRVSRASERPGAERELMGNADHCNAPWRPSWPVRLLS